MRVNNLHRINHRFRWSAAASLLFVAMACGAGQEPVAELVAETGGIGTPAWSGLTYKKHSLGRHITITLAVSEPPARSMTAGNIPRPTDPPAPLSASRPALLEVTAQNDEQPTVLRIWFDARDGSVLQRERLRPGAEGSHKVYRFGRSGATRIRLAPAGPRAQGTAGGSQRRETTYAYDIETAGCSTVTVPALLLVLLPRLAPDTRGISRCVFASDALYRVWFEPQGRDALAVDYTVTDASGRHHVSGRRSLEKIALRIEPIDQDAEVADFELLELRGDIVLYLDRDSGLPVQITGARGLMKDIHVQLSAARLER